MQGGPTVCTMHGALISGKNIFIPDYFAMKTTHTLNINTKINFESKGVLKNLFRVALK